MPSARRRDGVDRALRAVVADVVVGEVEDVDAGCCGAGRPGRRACRGSCTPWGRARRGWRPRDSRLPKARSARQRLAGAPPRVGGPLADCAPGVSPRLMSPTAARRSGRTVTGIGSWRRRPRAGADLDRPGLGEHAAADAEVAAAVGRRRGDRVPGAAARARLEDDAVCAGASEPDRVSQPPGATTREEALAFMPPPTPGRPPAVAPIARQIRTPIVAAMPSMPIRSLVRLGRAGKGAGSEIDGAGGSAGARRRRRARSGVRPGASVV